MEAPAPRDKTEEKNKEKIEENVINHASEKVVNQHDHYEQITSPKFNMISPAPKEQMKSVLRDISVEKQA